MGRAYSMDLRRAVAAARDRGMSTADVARTFGCSPAWVRRLRQRQRATGSLAPADRVAPDQRKVDDDAERRIRAFLADKPDATLAELIDGCRLGVVPGALSRRLAAMDLPRKKSRPGPPSRTAPT